MAELRIGTCSWKYPSWEGLVYSPNVGTEYLREYARRFSTVEIDQWFWTLPEPSTAAEYAAATPDDFLFTIKLPSALSLTHLREGKRGEAPRPNPRFLSTELFMDVLARLQPLHGKIGMLMLQFEYLNLRKMASAAALLERLGAFFDAVPRGLPCAVELRNPRWLDERYFAFLAERGLYHVYLQGYYMPPVEDAWRRLGQLLRGAAVVRLHGPDRKGMEALTGESWNRIVAPRDEELSRIAAMVNDMRSHGLTVFINVNNHYEGSAPLTIERLLERGLDG
jgi:uncharacterized protein YecE (DUF72 family)